MSVGLRKSTGQRQNRCVGVGHNSYRTEKEPSKEQTLLGSQFVYMGVLSDDFAAVDVREELCYHSRPKKHKFGELMKANKKRQTIEMHFRYNKIYDTAVSPKPSTRHGTKVKILSKNSSIASAFNYTLPIALKIYGYNCAYKSTMSEFSS